MGRPSKYTKAIADSICERLADGESLRAICRDDDMPPESTVRRWAADDVEGFSAHYARARDIGLERMADELLEIADDGTNDFMERQIGEDGPTATVVDHEHISRSKLRVDTRKWLLSKMAPKKYGDRIENSHNVHGKVEIELIQID